MQSVAGSILGDANRNSEKYYASWFRLPSSPAPMSFGMPLGLHGPAKTDCRTCLGRSPRASDLSIGKVARNSPRVRGEHSILAIELSDEEGEPAKHPSGSEWPTLVIQCSWRGALRNARAKHSLESVRYGRSRKRGVKGCPTLADLPQPTRQGQPWQRSTLLYFTFLAR